jgi:hypothetical protein
MQPASGAERAFRVVGASTFRVCALSSHNSLERSGGLGGQPSRTLACKSVRSAVSCAMRLRP